MNYLKIVKKMIQQNNMELPKTLESEFLRRKIIYLRYWGDTVEIVGYKRYKEERDMFNLIQRYGYKTDTKEFTKDLFMEETELIFDIEYINNKPKLDIDKKLKKVVLNEKNGIKGVLFYWSDFIKLKEYNK